MNSKGGNPQASSGALRPPPPLTRHGQQARYYDGSNRVSGFGHLEVPGRVPVGSQAQPSHPGFLHQSAGDSVPRHQTHLAPPYTENAQVIRAKINDAVSRNIDTQRLMMAPTLAQPGQSLPQSQPFKTTNFPPHCYGNNTNVPHHSAMNNLPVRASVQPSMVPNPAQLQYFKKLEVERLRRQAQGNRMNYPPMNAQQQHTIGSNTSVPGGFMPPSGQPRNPYPPPSSSLQTSAAVGYTSVDSGISHHTLTSHRHNTHVPSTVNQQQISSNPGNSTMTYSQYGYQGVRLPQPSTTANIPGLSAPYNKEAAQNYHQAVQLSHIYRNTVKVAQQQAFQQQQASAARRAEMVQGQHVQRPPIPQVMPSRLETPAPVQDTNKTGLPSILNPEARSKQLWSQFDQVFSTFPGAQPVSRQSSQTSVQNVSQNPPNIPIDMSRNLPVPDKSSCAYPQQNPTSHGQSDYVAPVCHLQSNVNQQQLNVEDGGFTTLRAMLGNADDTTSSIDLRKNPFDDKSSEIKKAFCLPERTMQSVEKRPVADDVAVLSRWYSNPEPEPVKLTSSVRLSVNVDSIPGMSLSVNPIEGHANDGQDIDLFKSCGGEDLMRQHRTEIEAVTTGVNVSVPSQQESTEIPQSVSDPLVTEQKPVLTDSLAFESLVQHNPAQFPASSAQTQISESRATVVNAAVYAEPEEVKPDNVPQFPEASRTEAHQAIISAGTPEVNMVSWPSQGLAAQTSLSSSSISSVNPPILSVAERGLKKTGSADSFDETLMRSIDEHLHNCDDNSSGSLAQNVDISSGVGSVLPQVGPSRDQLYEEEKNGRKRSQEETDTADEDYLPPTKRGRGARGRAKGARGKRGKGKSSTRGKSMKHLTNIGRGSASPGPSPSRGRVNVNKGGVGRGRGRGMGRGAGTRGRGAGTRGRKRGSSIHKQTPLSRSSSVTENLDEMDFENPEKVYSILSSANPAELEKGMVSLKTLLTIVKKFQEDKSGNTSQEDDNTAGVADVEIDVDEVLDPVQHAADVSAAVTGAAVTGVDATGSDVSNDAAETVSEMTGALSTYKETSRDVVEGLNTAATDDVMMVPAVGLDDKRKDADGDTSVDISNTNTCTSAVAGIDESVSKTIAADDTMTESGPLDEYSQQSVKQYIVKGTIPETEKCGKVNSDCDNNSFHDTSGASNNKVSESDNNQSGSKHSNNLEDTNSNNTDNEKSTNLVPVNTYILSETHRMTWIRFHGKVVTSLILPDGKFVILKEIIKRCFRINDENQEDKVQKRQMILTLKRCVLNIPDRWLDHIFYPYVDKSLREREVMKTVPRKMSIVSEAEASQLFHYVLRDHYCGEGCVTPCFNSEISNKKDSAKSEQTSTAKSTLSKTSPRKDSASRNVFEFVETHLSPSKSSKKSTGGVIVVELDSDGYDTDSTLPYVDGEADDKFKEKEPGVKSNAHLTNSNDNAVGSGTISIDVQCNCDKGIERVEMDEDDDVIFVEEEKVQDKVATREDVIVIDDSHDDTADQSGIPKNNVDGKEQLQEIAKPVELIAPNDSVETTVNTDADAEIPVKRLTEPEASPEVELDTDEICDDIEMLEELDIPMLLPGNNTSEKGRMFLEAEKSLNNLIRKANKAKKTEALGSIFEELIDMVPWSEWTLDTLDRYNSHLDSTPLADDSLMQLKKLPLGDKLLS